MDKSSSGIEEDFKRIKPKHYPIIAFIITAVVEALIFVFCNIFIGGEYVIARSDMAQQYIPFIRYFSDALKGNRGFFYTWGLDFGMGTAGTFAYYTMSPLNLLYLFSTDSNVMAITTIVIILKSSLAAAFFQVFSSKLIKRNVFESVLFAVMYGLCGYSVCFYFNIIWTDALYIFPLIMLGAYKLIKEDKMGLLLAAYFIQFLSNFYIAYSVGILSFILIAFYYVYSFKERTRKSNFMVVIKYLVCVITPLLLTAFFWLPGVYQIISNLEPMYADYNIWQSNPILMLNNMTLGQMQTLSAVVPYVYSGLLSVLLLPMYFINRHIPKKEKILSASAIVVMLLTFFVPSIRYFMHAFNNPEMFAYRYSFVFSFIVCLIGCRQIPFIRKVNWKTILITVLAVAAVFAVSGYIFDSKLDRFLNCNNLPNAFFNAVLIAAWIAVIAAYKKKFNLISIRGIAVALIAAEMILNGVICINNMEHKPEEKEFFDYCSKLYNNTFDEIELLNTEKYYRVNLKARRQRNIGALQDVNSVSYFNSVENMNTNRALSKLGIARHIHLIDGFGLMPITESLLGVKYVINGDTEVVGEDVYNTYELQENNLISDRPVGKCFYRVNDRALSLGYMVDNAITDYSFEKSPFANLSNLLSAMTGEKIDCFEDTSAKLSCVNGNYAFCNENQNAEYLDTFDADTVTVLQHNAGHEKETAVFSYTVENNDKPLYIYLAQKRFAGISDTSDVVTINTPDETGAYEYMIIPLDIVPAQIVKVGHNAEGRYQFDIELPDYVSSEYYEEQFFEYYDDTQFEKAYDILSEHQWNITEFKDGYVKGTIEADKDGIMFTSIPYDEGWTVYVDQKAVDKEALLESAFIGVQLPAGKHQIEMVYITPKIKMGTALSIAGLLIIVLLGLAKFNFSRKMVRVSECDEKNENDKKDEICSERTEQ